MACRHGAGWWLSGCWLCHRRWGGRPGRQAEQQFLNTEAGMPLVPPTHLRLEAAVGQQRAPAAHGQADQQLPGRLAARLGVQAPHCAPAVEHVGEADGGKL
jgi:hypothetical protein